MQCPKVCLECTATGQCSECDADKGYKLVDKRCVCKGYTLTDGSCLECSDNNGCLKCLGPGACLKCDKQYTLVGGKCEHCPDGCADCSSLSICTSCSSGYVMEGGKCKACPPSCGKCTADQRRCLTCLEGYTLVKGVCTECTDFRCTKCADGNPAKCQRCLSGALARNGTCLEVRPCTCCLGLLAQSCLPCPCFLPACCRSVHYQSWGVARLSDHAKKRLL